MNSPSAPSRREDSWTSSLHARTSDHTGFNVLNVNEYRQKLAAMAIRWARLRGQETPIAFVTYRAGTRIEINQGLESR
jgi:hypothetical protein